MRQAGWWCAGSCVGERFLAFFARLPPCLVGMEACATAHHWGRELIKLGHTVKLMPPAYVKPYVKRGKTDAADAEAIAEAVTRPTMRFVAVKSMDQQAALMLHKIRDLLVRQSTMLINALRGHLAEFGVVTARGPVGSRPPSRSSGLPGRAYRLWLGWPCRAGAISSRRLALEIRTLEREIVAWHRHDDASRRLDHPRHRADHRERARRDGTGRLAFRSGRQFAAWLGLTPRAHSSGGKERLGGISKIGDGYLRRLLVMGATAVIRLARQGNPSKVWATRLLERKPARVVSVALANKTARIAWAVLARNQSTGRLPCRPHRSPATTPAQGVQGW